MFNVLFYGDSNTWGYDPETGLRYPYEKRWTSICARILGPDYNCIPAGMNGRTTAFDDPVKGSRNGIKGLDYELQTHKPLDLMVIMLGTNDLKYTDAEGSAAGMDRLVDQVVSANERYNLSSPVFPGAGYPEVHSGDYGKTEKYREKAPVWIISPVLLQNCVNPSSEIDSVRESGKLSKLYFLIAQKYNTFFTDASLYASPSVADGIHLGPEGHALLGKEIASQIAGELKVSGQNT